MSAFKGQDIKKQIKLNVINSKKYHFTSEDFADWFVIFKIFKFRAKTVLKIYWSVKTP